MKHTETWEAGTANGEFETITERKSVCKALRTPSDARCSPRRFLLRQPGPEVPPVLLAAHGWPQDGSVTHTAPRCTCMVGQRVGEGHRSETPTARLHAALAESCTADGSPDPSRELTEPKAKCKRSARQPCSARAFRGMDPPSLRITFLRKQHGEDEDEARALPREWGVAQPSVYKAGRRKCCCQEETALGARGRHGQPLCGQDPAPGSIPQPRHTSCSSATRSHQSLHVYIHIRL